MMRIKTFKYSTNFADYTETSASKNDKQKDQDISNNQINQNIDGVHPSNVVCVVTSWDKLISDDIDNKTNLVFMMNLILNIFREQLACNIIY